MLADARLFAEMEQRVIKNGMLTTIEENGGPIKGRMMITLDAVPENVAKEMDGKKVYAFKGTFDFYDAEIGIAIEPEGVKAASGIWITPQKEGAENPSAEWVQFFVNVLVKNMPGDGSFKVPIFTFANDNRAFTVTEDDFY